MVSSARRAQLRAPIGGEARRKRLEGREQRTLRARLLRLRAHVTDRPFDGHLWLRKSGADATRHVRGLGRVVRGERLEPGEPGLGVVLRDERRAERRVIGGRIEPISADERDALLVEDEACERDIDPVGEEGMIERVGTRTRPPRRSPPGDRGSRAAAASARPRPPASCPASVAARRGPLADRRAPDRVCACARRSRARSKRDRRRPPGPATRRGRTPDEPRMDSIAEFACASRISRLRFPLQTPVRSSRADDPRDHGAFLLRRRPAVGPLRRFSASAPATTRASRPRCPRAADRGARPRVPHRLRSIADGGVPDTSGSSTFISSQQRRRGPVDAPARSILARQHVDHLSPARTRLRPDGVEYTAAVAFHKIDDPRTEIAANRSPTQRPARSGPRRSAPRARVDPVGEAVGVVAVARR